MFRGSGVALVTPFTADGSALDVAAFKQLLDFHAANGTQAIILCGTTGESPTLSHAKHKEVVRVGVEHLKCKSGQVPHVMAGTGSNSTAEALELSRDAKAAGADSLLLVSPYYNKPTQAGLLAHFQTIAREVEVPQVLYNIQGRTGVNINTDTLLELAKEKNIVGVKEASGNVGQMSDVIRLRPDGFMVYSGDDNLTFSLSMLGGDGVISVLANVAPKLCRQFTDACLEGRLAEARELHHRLTMFVKALFIETNPIPVKVAVNILAEAGVEGVPPVGPLRMPLSPVADGTVELLKSEMKTLGLI